jgi:hypothetical protein
VILTFIEMDAIQSGFGIGCIFGQRLASGRDADADLEDGTLLGHELRGKLLSPSSRDVFPQEIFNKAF